MKGFVNKGLLVSGCKTAASFLLLLDAPLNLDALSSGSVGGAGRNGSGVAQEVTALEEGEESQL